MSLVMNGRERVAAVLRAARRPLSPDEISSLAGMPLQSTKSRIADLVGRGEASNTGGKYEPRYVWLEGQEKRRKLPALVTPGHWRASTYTGEKPIPTRPGSLDFLDAPSVQGDVRVPRKRPVLMSYREE